MNIRFISRMVRVSILVVLVVCANPFPASPAEAASGSFAWVKSIGGTLFDYGTDIEVDPAGNIYTTGIIYGTVDIDPGPGTYYLPGAGVEDVFIVKMDNRGDLLWARRLGGGYEEQSSSLVVDPRGNVYTIGFFSGTLDIDPHPDAGEVTSAGGRDIFVFKHDSNGDYSWMWQIGGVGQDESHGLAVDSSGNVYLTGSFSDTIDFAPGPGIYSLASDGARDSFVAKLGADGRLAWARNIGDVGIERGPGLAVDASGNVYLTGGFSGNVDFDPGPGIANLSSAGFEDIFVSKLDTDGNFVWARSMGGTSYDHGVSLGVDAGGNVYTTGRFVGIVDFDPGPGVHNLTGPGGWDIFISKLDTDGSFVWARSIGGASVNSSSDLKLDANGTIYMAGSFTGTTDFDPGTGTYNLTTSSAGGSDIFISRLDTDGNLLWAGSMGAGMTGADVDRGEGIAVDASGSIYATGRFSGTADFDPGSGVYNLTSAGNTDAFILKLEETAIFDDVPPGHPALDYVERLYAAGITSGCTTDPLRYCPEGTVTRAEMAVFLLRGIHGADYVPPDVAGSTGFGDVPADYWAAAFIKQFAAEGITVGCGGGNYCPESSVTHAQMAVFLLRSKHGVGYTPPAVGTGTGFGDVPADYWAAAFIKQLAAEDITAGCGGGNYCPEELVTRAQMAMLMVRTFSLP